MRKELIELTPEKAKEFLKHNYIKNRKVRMSWVNTMAQDIKDDRWNYDISEVDQGLSITPDGTLINGQHRCHAVIKADKPIKVWVNFDVPMDLYNYMDCGKVRSPKDFITVPNATNIASLAKFLYTLENGKSSLKSTTQGVLIASKGKDHGHINTQTSRQQIIDTVNERNDYLQHIYLMSQRTSPYLGRKKSQIGYAFLTIDFVGNGYVLDEFASECSKINTESRVINICRSYMMQKIGTKNFNSSVDWVMACIFLAYDHFADDSDISSFNKYNQYFQKYDALMRKQRTKNNEDK